MIKVNFQVLSKIFSDYGEYLSKIMGIYELNKTERLKKMAEFINEYIEKHLKISEFSKLDGKRWYWYKKQIADKEKAFTQTGILENSYIEIRTRYGQYYLVDVIAKILGYKDFEDYLCKKGDFTKDLLQHQFKLLGKQTPKDCKISDEKNIKWLKGIYDFYYIPGSQELVHTGLAKISFDKNDDLIFNLKVIYFYRPIFPPIISKYDFSMLIQNFDTKVNKSDVLMYVRFGFQVREKQEQIFIGFYKVLSDDRPKLKAMLFIMRKIQDDEEPGQFEDFKSTIINLYEKLKLLEPNKIKIQDIIDLLLSSWLFHLDHNLAKQNSNLADLQVEIRQSVEYYKQNPEELVKKFEMYYRTPSNRIRSAEVYVIANWLYVSAEIVNITLEGTLIKENNSNKLEFKSSDGTVTIYLPNIENRKFLMGIETSRILDCKLRYGPVIFIEEQLVVELENQKILSEFLATHLTVKHIELLPPTAHDIADLSKLEKAEILKRLEGDYVLILAIPSSQTIEFSKMKIENDGFVEILSEEAVYNGIVLLKHNLLILSIQKPMQYRFIFSLTQNYPFKGDQIFGTFSGYTYQLEPFAGRVVMKVDNLDKEKYEAPKKYKLSDLKDFLSEYPQVLDFFLGRGEYKDWDVNLEFLNELQKLRNKNDKD